MISEEEHEQMPEPVRERLEALKDAPGSVIVVGSMNADYTVTTKRLPKPGETVNGGAMKVLPGGKGANQASAAARLGVNVQLLGAVGEDSNADFLLSKLDEAGVDTADILHVEGPSGTTVITVSAEGENTIVYSPGSNAKASAGYVQSHRTTIAECAVLGLCLESPIATVIAAAQTAHDAGVTVLLNDSPFMDELPHELVEATDILLVNQHEVAQLLGLPDDDVESLDWYEVAERFTDYGFDRAIVTLGASGSVVIENGRWHRVSAAQVNAVDTTGCGDSFMGTVLAGLAAGHTLLQSAQIGSYVFRLCGHQAWCPKCLRYRRRSHRLLQLTYNRTYVRKPEPVFRTHQDVVRACLRSADRGTGSGMAGNPFRSQCLGHRPYRFR